MTEHASAPFSHLHKARFDAGLHADRPTAPEGLGDAYLSTDTHILSVCYSATVLTWTEYDLDDIGAAPPPTIVFHGARVYKSSPTSIPDATQTAIGWDVDNFDNDSWHDEGGDNTIISVPADHNIVDILFALQIDASVATEWTIEIFGSGIALDPPETYVITTEPEFTAGTAFTWFNLTTLRYLPFGADIQIMVTQSSGGSLDIGASSWLAITERK